MVCVLAVIFSFIFGFLTINNYIHELYDNEEIDIGIDSKQYHCSSMLACIDSLYTQNIIGETVGRDSGNYGRFLSDLIHWSFFEILFSNIIAAIIIDKFAEQRHTKEKVEE